MAGALGKFLKGVAEVAVPAAMEEQRARILAKRDERLQGYDMQKMKGQQEFTSSENQAQREFTGEQNDLTRAIDQARLDLQKGQTEIDSKRIKSIISLTDLQIKDLELDMDKKTQINQLQQDVLDAKTSSDLDAALQKLQGFMGHEIYSPMTVYGEENDMGVQQRGSGVINRVTGGFTPMTMPKPSSDMSSPESIRDALRNGEISREKARELLQPFMQ